MSTVYLGLGTNLGDRINNLDRALRGLGERVAISAVSPIYETDAWGVEEQPDFLNMCIAGETELAPNALLQFVKRLEMRIGRLPSERWGPRLIDIDILFYDQLVFAGSALVIPHIGVVERATVLAPLADIAPDFVHPVSKQHVSEMLELVDRSGVRLFQA